MTSLESNRIISEWKLTNEPIKDIKIKSVRMILQILDIIIFLTKIFGFRVLFCMLVVTVHFSKLNCLLNALSIQYAVCVCAIHTVVGILNRTNVKTSKKFPI